jgi:hypothetical protein
LLFKSYSKVVTNSGESCKVIKANSAKNNIKYKKRGLLEEFVC